MYVTSYFRIFTFTLTLPPLRDRLEDIDVPAPFFVDGFLLEKGLPSKDSSRTALDKLKEYAYPGNIGELAQILKNAAFFSEGDMLTADDIELRGAAGGDGFWESLRNAEWDPSKAAFERSSCAAGCGKPMASNLGVTDRLNDAGSKGSAGPCVPDRTVACPIPYGFDSSVSTFSKKAHSPHPS